MKTRVLVIDDEARERVSAVVAYAMSHWYWINSDWVPGQVPEHTCQLGDYRCVFSFTVTPMPDFEIVRHLSISVPEKGMAPSFAAAAEIAGLFGFSGWENGVKAQVQAGKWIAGPHAIDPCVVIVEPVSEAREKTDAEA